MEKDSLDVDQTMEVLLRHLDPKKGVIGEEEIRNILEEKGRTLNIYWGTAPTGKPHLGYFVPIFKIADFLQVNCSVTILFADLHGFLDSSKEAPSWELIEARCNWYEKIIKEMLRMIQVPIDKLYFKKGTDFQLSTQYTLDMYRLAAKVTTVHTKHAGAEVVKKASSEPLMSSLLYPMLQALDEEYLDADVQFGGVDQLKLFGFAREKLPLLGYKKRAYLINPLIPSLSRNGKIKDGELNKMSASDASSKIDFDDSPNDIRKKIQAAYSVDGEVAENGLLAMCQFVLWRHLEQTGQPFVVPRPEQWGGTQVFKSYKELEKAFASKELLSADLKPAVSNLLIEFLEPLRNFCELNRNALLKAYPDPSHPLNSLDIRVGTVVAASPHPTNDQVYIESIDLGDEVGIRTVVSGIRDFVAIDDFKDSKVLVCCNVAPREAHGVNSAGMILCAATKGNDNRQVELLQLPAEVPNGTRLQWEGINPVNGDLPVISNSQLKKLLKCFRTDKERRFVYKDCAAVLDGQHITTNICDGVVR